MTNENWIYVCNTNEIDLEDLKRFDYENKSLCIYKLEDGFFANDVLGYTIGHIPRHARIYRQFKKEYEKLQKERVAAFKEFHSDTVNKKFNDPKITIGIEDREYEKFLELAEKI